MSGKKRKGLSIDEKKRVILGIYHERKEPFNLKEIENHGSKKGVVQQTIKDINQSLIDDGLVCGDKIGSANFFWSFPSKYYQEQLKLRDSLTQSISKCNASISSCTAELETSRNMRKMAGREALLKKLNDLQQEDKTISADLELLKFNDPVEIEKIKAASDKIKGAADRWTDNIWMIKSYLTKKKGMSGKEADAFLRIDSSFDYVVYEPPKANAKKAKSSAES